MVLAAAPRLRDYVALQLPLLRLRFLLAEALLLSLLELLVVAQLLLQRVW
jgi:hypothetical protein